MTERVMFFFAVELIISVKIIVINSKGEFYGRQEIIIN